MSFQFLTGEIGRIEHTDGDTATVHTEVTIDAAPEKVWNVLTDFEYMIEWSESLVNLQGDLQQGNTVEVTFKLGVGDHAQSIDRELTYLEEGKLFGWSGVFLLDMVDNHKYQVEPLPDGRTRFIQSDQIKGFMEHLVGGMLARQFMHSYVEFNRALKARVESMVD